jgi:hypothetical protein
MELAFFVQTPGRSPAAGRLCLMAARLKEGD